MLRSRRRAPGWLGRKDSNLRIRGPKPRALPLGHAPTRLRHAAPLRRFAVALGPSPERPPGRRPAAPAAAPARRPPPLGRTCCWYTESTFSSRYCRIWLFSGWAMSLNVPSLRFLLGIETNSPFGPWMILMSVTTKHWSNTMETNALSFSSSTGNDLDVRDLHDVRSFPGSPDAPCRHRPQRSAQHPAILLEGEGPAAQGAKAARHQRRLGPTRRRPHRRRARRTPTRSPRATRERAPSLTRIPRISPHLRRQVRRLFQGRPLEVVGRPGKAAACPPSALDTKRKIVWLFSRGVNRASRRRKTAAVESGRPGSTTTTWARTCRCSG